MTDDKFRWWNAWTNGSEPGAERRPNQLGKLDREILKQALGDDASLHEDVIGMDFAADLVSVMIRLAMKVLISVPMSQRFHIHHPEMVEE